MKIYEANCIKTTRILWKNVQKLQAKRKFLKNFKFEEKFKI